MLRYPLLVAPHLQRRRRLTRTWTPSGAWRVMRTWTPVGAWRVTRTWTPVEAWRARTT
jgi:hypothetical protein